MSPALSRQVRISWKRMMSTFSAAIMWILIVVAAYSYGGYIESYIYPVIDHQRIIDVRGFQTVDHRYQVCWVWKYHRSRVTTLDYAIFYGTLANRPFVFVSVSKGDARLVSPGITMGDDQEIPLCVNLPPGTVLNGEVRVYAMVAFSPNHGLWTVPTRAPVMVYNPEKDPPKVVEGLHAYDALPGQIRPRSSIVNGDIGSIIDG